jgi:transcriptional regulator with XRE-family HTH domain
MTDRPQEGTALREARAARGWSQSEAAREIVALGRSRGIPVAAAPSLKTLLSRWENARAQPEPQYRALLAALYGRSAEDLGIADVPAGPAPGSGAERLRAAVAAAALPDGGHWQAQLDAIQQLDARFGVAGAGTLATALVEQLEDRRAHSLTPATREAASGVLAGAAALAGAQALDRGEPEVAWRLGDRARAAAVEAGSPVAEAAALAGMAAALVEAGDAAAAVTLLETAPASGPLAATARLAAALGHARAASGDAAAAGAAFTKAFGATGSAADPETEAAPEPASLRVDAVRPAISVALADLHRRHGHALVALGDPAAAGPLHTALSAGPRTARHRAALHADLARALAAEHPTEAAEHARTARAIALRIGSVLIPNRLAGAP